MPKLSDTMTEGTLVKWHKKVGDFVEIGDVVAEIETDKSTMEMEAFDEGILSNIQAQEGEKIPVGTTLAVLLEEGESAEDATTGSSSPSQEPATESPSQESKNTQAQQAQATPQQQSNQPSPDANQRVKASPLARKVASAQNLDLSQYSGSGPNGRIVKADLENAPTKLKTKAPASQASNVSNSAASPKAMTPVISKEDTNLPLSPTLTIAA